MRSRGDHQVVPEEFAPLITGKSFGNCYSVRALFHSLAYVCLTAVEVATGPLSGPLTGLDVTRGSADVVAPEATLPRGGMVGDPGASLSAAPAAPSDSAALTAVVTGVKSVLVAQLDGLGNLDEASLSGLRAMSRIV